MKKLSGIYNVEGGLTRNHTLNSSVQHKLFELLKDLPEGEFSNFRLINYSTRDAGVDAIRFEDEDGITWEARIVRPKKYV